MDSFALFSVADVLNATNKSTAAVTVCSSRGDVYRS